MFIFPGLVELWHPQSGYTRMLNGWKVGVGDEENVDWEALCFSDLVTKRVCSHVLRS